MVTGIADAARIPAFAPAMAEVPFQLWFDDKTGLLRWLQLDLTGVARDSLGLAERRPDDPPPPPGMPAVVASARVTVDLNDIKLDTAVPASLFTYQPAEHVQKVAAFDWAGPDPQKLIGQPAPEFAGEDLDGKPLALPHFRGRVLVLDFWATWCVPCLMAMPQIQQLHDSYAEKPVTVLGVNQDNPQAKGRVRELIAERKYTFRHLMDPKSEVGRSFQVGGIPCTIVIDQQGVIRSVHVGFSPDLEKDLRAKIDELLKTN
jgi:thiol-disulfide isomerase/thioredoxin